MYKIFILIEKRDIEFVNGQNTTIKSHPKKLTIEIKIYI